MGVGVCVSRDNNGNALADFYEETNNTKAETKALLQGLQMCQIMSIFNVDIELDSMVVCKLSVQGLMSMPWAIAYEMRKTKVLLQLFNFSICHVFREANHFADFLANLGVKEQKLL